ncbi:hypothetical protein BLNAU_18926 [Blattamonas nauphoetae]|uniref:Uncharacterized protein n=1 Tax=Blattamonas nauphoetae TaxID=2049346 RepID=A0ABQ9X486_9EUKA|nr:hypothetical protein BLNAU_18926 [Blattamonas nauphoetae]
MKCITQGDSAQFLLQTEHSQFEEKQDVAAKEEKFDEADALADAIEQLIARLAAVQDSKTQNREVFHTLNLEKAKLPTNEQKVCDTAQEQHFAEQKHHRHPLTATFSIHNVLFTVSTAEEGAEDTLHAAEALVKTKEAGRDEMKQQ